MYPRTASQWLRITPWGLNKMMNWIKVRYNNPVIMVTEAGVSDAAGYLDDSMRVYFYKYYINNILKGSINFYFVFKHQIN